MSAGIKRSVHRSIRGGKADTESATGESCLLLYSIKYVVTSTRSVVNKVIGARCAIEPDSIATEMLMVPS